MSEPIVLSEYTKKIIKRLSLLFFVLGLISLASAIYFEDLIYGVMSLGFIVGAHEGWKIGRGKYDPK